VLQADAAIALCSGESTLTVWQDCFRVLKPGAYLALVSEGISQTRNSLGIRSAGFVLRDTLLVLGHGTLVLLFRKPMTEDTLVKQVLATGTGGMNLDACRVAGVADLPGSRRVYRRFDDREDLPELEPPPPPHRLGRWPANVLLRHAPGCVLVGTREEEAPTINRFDDGMKPFGDGAGHEYTQSHGPSMQQPVFECAPGCMVSALDGQSGEASRYFPQHTEMKQLIEWVIRLILPPGGELYYPLRKTLRKSC
jgi:site-specific DNA-methyltransferase (adenine-specific)